MLKRILLALITFFTLGNLVSQCVTNTALVDSYLQARSQTWGFMPDTIDNLPTANVNSLYNETIQVKWAATTQQLNPNATNVSINYIEITDVIGLPPGLTFISNTSTADGFYCDGQGANALNCKWAGGLYGCFRIEGTPTTTGSFPLTINVTVNVPFAGDQPESFDGFEIVVNPFVCISYSDTLFTTNSICSGDSLFFNNSFIKNAGKYYDSTIYGNCDSVIELNLIEVDYRDTISVSTCDSLISPSGNYTYTANGTYSDTLPSTLGCDSIIVTTLTLGEIYSTTLSTICPGDSILAGGVYRKTQGLYYDTITLSGGCDSIIETNLSFILSVYDTIAVNWCESQTYFSPAGNIYFTTGLHNDTLTSTLTGCDSIITIDLTMLQVTNSFNTYYVCDSFISLNDSRVYYVNGIYTDTILNAAGCDSLVDFDLRFGTIDTTVIYDTLFTGGTYYSTGGYNYSNTGVYYETETNQYSCDSVTELNLYFKQDTLCTGTIQIDSLGSNYYRLSFKDSNIIVFDTVRWEITFGGFTNFYYGDSVLVNFIDSGTHTILMDYIEDIMGGSPVCRIEDSIYMPSTFVNQSLPIIATIVDTNCYFLQSPLGNYYYTTGLYYDTTLTLDSVYVLDYYIKQSNQNFIFDTVCGNYQSTNGTIYNTSGAYEELYETQTNCYWDSLWLVINPGTGGAYFYFNQNTPNVIELVDSSYGADLSYKWRWGDGTYDSAVTTPSHTYANTGLYEVCLELTDTVNGCKYYYCDSLDIDSNGVMRSTFTLNVIKYGNTVGVNDNTLNNSINLYPNPAQNELWIESEQEMINYKILSISGQLITESSLTGKKSTINISDIANGYYLIGVKTKNGTLFKKITITK